MKAFVVGRVSADMYPVQLQTRLSEVSTFERFIGGFAANVSVGLARLGTRAAILSRVGDDGHGEFCKNRLAQEGVDVRWLGVDPVYRTALAFCEVWPPDHFPITFYRLPSCPDWQLTFDDVPWDELGAASLMYLSGTGLAQSPSREVHLALAERFQGRLIFDLDWRPGLWRDHRDYPVLTKIVASHSDLVIGNEDEVVAAFGSESLAAQVVFGNGGHALIVKRGAEGATILTSQERQEVRGHRVEVVNGLGAGDAFAASLGNSLLRGLSLESAVESAVVSGALVASRLACSDAMPTEDELQRAIGAYRVSTKELR